eukprot:11666100-Karenia_brevis.AAC.1
MQNEYLSLIACKLINHESRDLWNVSETVQKNADGAWPSEATKKQKHAEFTFKTITRKDDDRFLRTGRDTLPQTWPSITFNKGGSMPYLACSK